MVISEISIYYFWTVVYHWELTLLGKAKSRIRRGLLRYRVKGQRRQLRRKGRAGEQWAQRMNPKGLPVFPGSGAGPLPGAPMLE